MGSVSGPFRIPAAYSDKLHFLGLALVAVGLPLSRFLMSVGGILLVAEWLIGGSPAQRVRSAFKDPAVLLLIAVFGVHLIGLLYTSDLEQGWNDVRIKLPLLLFPLILGGREGKERPMAVIWIFFGAFFLSSMLGFLEWSGSSLFSDETPEEASLFISPIRMSLMGCLGIAFAFLFLIRDRPKPSVLSLLLFFIAWCLFYLFILATGISILVLFFLSLAALGFWWRKSGKWVPLLLILLLPLFSAAYLTWEVREHFHVEEDPLNDRSRLEERTARGNPYEHDTSTAFVQNGYYVGHYICEEELRKVWNARSEIAFDGKDEEGNRLRYTLIRYMSSKGLKKDAEGMGRMSAEDVQRVEKGVANIAHHEMLPPRKKLHSVLFEMDRYFKGYDPSGNSATQRFEFWRAGWDIIQHNPFFGVGTGDLNRAYDRAYERIDTPLEEEYRLRAHHQFLSIWIAFGPIGLLIFVLSLILPPRWKKAFQDPYYIAFFIVGVLSFFTEDTLESQAGVTLFAFWNAFLLFRKEKGRE